MKNNKKTTVVTTILLMGSYMAVAQCDVSVSVINISCFGESDGIATASDTDSCASAPSGMIAWWPGNGNADDIQGGYHGTFQNGASSTAGLVSQAFSLDGSDDYISTPDNEVWELQEGTFITWFKTSANPGSAQVLICSFNYTGVNTQTGVFFAVSANNKLRMDIYDNGGASQVVDIESAVTVNDGAWHLGAVTWSPAGTARLYLDGALANTANYNGTVTYPSGTNTDLIIGASTYFGQSSVVSFFNGQIDEPQVYDRALSLSEIQAIYNAGAAGVCQPYSYTWSNGDTTATADSLTAGIYYVTVTSTDGCMAVDTITINEPAILGNSVNVTNTTCSGCCDGSASTTASGGTLPYTYNWNDPASQTGSTATGLCAGTHTVTVTDGNGCQKTDTVIVTEPTGIERMQADHEVWAFPNPFNEQTTLIISPYRRGQFITLYNLLGDELRKIPVTGQQTTINREDLPNGIYFYEITNDSQKLTTGKLIIH